MAAAIQTERIPALRHERAAFWLILLLIFASRVPFLSAGFGHDRDGWSVVDAARHIAQFGVYCPSRMPGYPLVEFATSLYSGAPPIIINGVTAVMSTVAAGAFIRLMRRLGCRDALLAGAALAFTPVVYSFSTTPLDYLWALAFMLLAMNGALSVQPIRAGFLLGLAIGCRPTSGAMLPVVLILLADAARRSGQPFWKRGLVLSIICLAVGATAFVPSLLRYGTSFITYQDYLANSSLAIMAYRASAPLWGCIGSAVLAMVIVASAVAKIMRGGKIDLTGADGSTVIFRGRAAVVACVLGIAIYLAAFIHLPAKSVYLMPCVPLLLILLAGWLGPRAFQIVGIGLCLSPFFCSLDRDVIDQGGVTTATGLAFRVGGQRLMFDLLRGPIIRDRDTRIQEGVICSRIIDRAGSLSGCAAIVVGSWTPVLRCQLENRGASLGDTADTRPWAAVKWRRAQGGEVQLLYAADRVQVEDVRARGCGLFILEGMEAFNRDLMHFDLAGAGARLIDLGSR